MPVRRPVDPGEAPASLVSLRRRYLPASLIVALYPVGIADADAFGVTSLPLPTVPSPQSGIFVTAEFDASEPGVGDHTVYASDVGYRTASTDPGGLVAYPARISDAIMLTRAVELSPGAPGVATAWGTLTLANPDGLYNSMATWNNDGHDVVIKYGRKTFDGTRGYWTDPPSAGMFSLFAGVQSTWRLENRELNIPLRDATQWLDRPIQTTQYGGAGFYDGSAGLAGLTKPKLRGIARNIAPVLIDPVNLIYQYNDGPGQTLVVWEGGVGTYLFDANTTNLYIGTTPPGKYRTDDSRGLFQLGTEPVYQVTIDAAGHFPVAGYKYKLAEIARYLLTEDAALPAQFIDTTEFAVAAAAHPATGGWYFPAGDTTVGVAALAAILVGLGAKLVPKRDGRLGLFVLRALAGTETPVAILDTSTAVSVVARALPNDVSPPAWRIRAGYRYNTTVQTSGLNPTINQTRAQFVASTGFSSSWSDAAVQTAYARPNDIGPVPTALDQTADATALATAWGALWGVRRRLLDIVVPLDIGLGLDIGNVVTVAWPMDDLAGGALGQVVGDNMRTADATLTVTVLI